MIVRLWRGQAPASTADAYVKHATEKIFPSLATLAGHRGAWLLRREVEEQTEFLVLTLWDSCDAIRSFSGDDIAMAVVESEGRAALSSFDDFARHYEIVFKSS